MPIMRGGSEVFSPDWNDSFSGVLERTKCTGNGPERGGSGVEEVAQGSPRRDGCREDRVALLAVCASPAQRPQKGHLSLPGTSKALSWYL